MSAAATRYDETFAAWRADPSGWWQDAATAIAWDAPPARAFDPAQGVYGRWFPGGRLNTCFNAVDRHVAAGRGAQAAIIWDRPSTMPRCRTAWRGSPARWPRAAWARAIAW
jgi:propionyl-CoA synthetase